MICFCYFCQKNCFPCWVCPNDPFLVETGPKKQFLRGFTNFFFRTTGMQHKLLILFESPIIFHWKSAEKSKVGVVFGTKSGPK